MRRRPSPRILQELMELSPPLAAICVWVSVALASGCLPDPPPYDACTGENSEYYVVAPKGCNGHELLNLFSRETEHVELSTADLIQRTNAISLLRGSLQLDGRFLYWMAPEHTVLRTHTRDKTHLPLYRAAGIGSAVIGVSGAPHELYVAEIDLDMAPDGPQRVTSRIIALDLDSPEIGSLPTESVNGMLPSYARVAAELADMNLTKIATVGDRFYFTSDYASTIRSGKLGRSAITRTSDLEVVVGAMTTEFRLSDANELNYVAYNAPLIDNPSLSLKRLHLDSGKTEVILSLGGNDNGARLFSRNGELYLFTCDNSDNRCQWSRVEGDRVVVADELSTQGLETPMAVDARGLFVIGSPRNHMALPLLLDYTATPTAPSIIAAPIVASVPLELDEEYLYVQSDYSYTTINSRGNSTTIEATRLLRIRR
ncbi:MAG TPA: hypothetical protein VKP30_18060 [Polyangiaceae bacterium]|nr:hypothetical protein [Polyangiaceae bacterium]